MNLNHIAKKPILDYFYMKPYMADLLRAALFDAMTVHNGKVM